MVGTATDVLRPAGVYLHFLIFIHIAPPPGAPPPPCDGSHQQNLCPLMCAGANLRGSCHTPAGFTEVCLSGTHYMRVAMLLYFGQVLNPNDEQVLISIQAFLVPSSQLFLLFSSSTVFY